MSAMSLGMSSRGAVSLGSVKVPKKYFQRFGTGIESIDNMFGDGGFIKGQVIALSAMRGAGKTTAMLQIMEGVMNHNKNKSCLYLSGEEYVEQLAFTAMRINTPNVLADNETDIDTIADLTKQYDIIVIDSVAALTHPTLQSSNKKEEYAVNTLYKAAHENDCVVILILHMTKDGKSKGNSSLEHTVDTCIKIYNVDSEEFGELNCKAFCVDKNRFGQTKDSIFRMTKHGWDFTDPIKEDYDQKSGSKGAGDPRKIRRMNELKAICEAMINKSGPFRVTDLRKVVEDVEDYDRFTRRLKELEKMGVVKKNGRGAKASYRVSKKDFDALIK
jgi:predicted ATP-dependent serine protease